MEIQHLPNNLNWLLLRASLRTKQGLMKISNEYDLSVMQAFTLCLLQPDKSFPMNSISELLLCDPSNVTGIVDRLVSGGYIQRRESTTDRRVKMLEITESGQKLRNELFQRITDSQLPALSKLSTEEAETLKMLLLKTLPDLDFKK